jgi:excisionase family DNA binding protein
MTENYCTTREAAALLGVSLRTAQQWVEKGLLEGWKTAGGHRRITRGSVERALKEGRGRAAASRVSSPMKILIIEDDATLLKLYRRRMELWPFPTTIFTAPNGYEGLVMVGEVAPLLLISDLRLPGVSGFQIVRYLCNIERYEKMAIVVISGLPTHEIDAHGGVPPRVQVMAKPIDFARLQQIAARARPQQ